MISKLNSINLAINDNVEKILFVDISVNIREWMKINVLQYIVYMRVYNCIIIIGLNLILFFRQYKVII